MLKKLFLPIFLLILIGYASLETLKISRFVKNEITFYFHYISKLMKFD